MHLYAVCVDCLEGVHKIICIKCKSRWDGSWHQLGTMYTYDILAASPCCQVGIYPSERVVGALRLLSPDECRGVRGSTAVMLEEVGGCGEHASGVSSRATPQSPAVTVDLLQHGAAVTGILGSH